MAKRPPEIEKIHEIGKTCRWGFVCVVVIVGMFFVYSALVKYWELHHPPGWVAITLAVFGAFTAPSIMAKILWKRIRQFTAVTIRRLTNLETEKDPKRLSSGLKGDGTNKPEDRL